TIPGVVTDASKAPDHERPPRFGNTSSTSPGVSTSIALNPDAATTASADVRSPTSGSRPLVVGDRKGIPPTETPAVAHDWPRAETRADRPMPRPPVPLRPETAT